MTTYGFRLFEVSLYEGRKQKPIPFVEKQKETQRDYTKYLVSLLPDRIAEVQRGLPHLSDAVDEDPDSNLKDKTKPLFRLIEVKKRGNHLEMLVENGRRSGHKNAMADPDDEDVDDVDIENHYPARTYRAALILPASGTVGVLAVETISRACPQAPIVKWLSKWSKDDSEYKEFLDPDDDAYIPWWNLKAKVLGDDETRDRFMANGTVKSIRLFRNAITGDRKRASEEFELVSKITGPERRSAILGKAGDWFLQKKKGAKTDSVEAAKQIAAIVSEDVSGLEFDDVDVTIEDTETGQTKTIRPDVFSDVFIYPLTKHDEPEDPEFYGAIRGRVTKLEKSMKTSFNWDGWPKAKG